MIKFGRDDQKFLDGRIKKTLLNSDKNTLRFLSELSDRPNYKCTLTWGINGVCPEKLYELGRLSELSVAELSDHYNRHYVMLELLAIKQTFLPVNDTLKQGRTILFCATKHYIGREEMTARMASNKCLQFLSMI